MLEITRLTASKFNGEQAGTSTIFTLSASTTSTLTFTIPDGYVFYLLEFGGNSQSPGLQVQLRNNQSTDLQEYSDFPDSFVIIPYYPFLRDPFETNMNVRFTNNNSASQVVTFMLTGILIPERKKYEFEQAIFNYLGIGGLN